MFRIYAGGVLIIAGIAASIEAHRHVPVPARRPEIGLITPASGLSPTAYDLLRIGGWALVIFGTVTVVLGLIRYGVRYAAGAPPNSGGISINGSSPPEEPVAVVRAPSPDDTEPARPWDDGSHGEAVQPNLM